MAEDRFGTQSRVDAGRRKLVKAAAVAGGAVAAAVALPGDWKKRSQPSAGCRRTRRPRTRDW